MDDDNELSFDVESEEQFWDGRSCCPSRYATGQTCAEHNTGLDNVFAAPSDNHEAIDDALRSFIAITTRFKRMA